jgi:hypothetical protein
MPQSNTTPQQFITDYFAYCSPDEYDFFNIYNEFVEVMHQEINSPLSSQEEVADYVAAHQWCIANPVEAKKFLEDVHQEALERMEDNRRRDNMEHIREIAREAGAMYGMQGYHDHMPYTVDFEPDDCFACGGGGCHRCW